MTARSPYSIVLPVIPTRISGRVFQACGSPGGAGGHLGSVPCVPATAPPDQPARSGAPSVPLRVVVGVVGLEALLLLAVTVFFLGEIVLRGASDTGAAVGTAALAALAGGFLGVCARALWRRQRWARGPVICWQLLQLLTAATTSFSERWWAPAMLLVASLVAGVGLLLPRVTAETTVPADPPVL
jgi:hypothetical protein